MTGIFDNRMEKLENIKNSKKNLVLKFSFHSFVSQYERNGIEFDHIYGWEISPMEPQDRFWLGVPHYLTDKISFYNVPAQADQSSNHNPISVLKSICQVITIQTKSKYKFDATGYILFEIEKAI